MSRIKLWPHLTILLLLCGAIGAIATELWLRHRENTQAQTLVNAARIERVDGEVGLDRGFNDGTSPQWVALTPNSPVSVGDRIYVRDNSRAGIAFTGRNFARLEPNTSLDVLSLSNDRTQLALREGSALFNVGRLMPGELFEVATPMGAVDLNQPGLYQIGINNRGNTIISVLSGLAQVVGLGGTGQLSKGQMLTLLGQTAADVILSRLDPSYAGGLVNDYYSYQYPGIYDGRYSSYDAYLNDPYYYDPYNRFTSYQYVSDLIPGVYYLDSYGDWRNLSGYGYAWSPRVDTGWSPYQQGYWTMDDPYGLTWVSSEPWGYAPYHYGRWAYVNNRWFWIPDGVNTQPTYAPALVAFVPLTQVNEIGWVPLGPGDPYVPTYYDQNWQPQYLTQAPVTLQQVVNLNVPGALTVVPVQDFSETIAPTVITRVDPQVISQVRPVLDPLSVDELRRAAMRTAEAGRRVDVPQAVVQRLENTQVITSVVPPAPPFRTDLAQRLRVSAVPDNQKKQKLQLREERGEANEREAEGARQPAPVQTQADAAANQERNRRMEELSAEAARGDRGARRQVQQLEREQQQAARQQAQGERVSAREQQRAQREAERQQMITAQQQQRAATQQQIEARREANRQAAQQRTQAAPPVQREQRGRAEQRPGRPVIQQPPGQRGEQQQPRPQPQAQRPPEQVHQQQPHGQLNEQRHGPPQQGERGAGRSKGHP